MRIVSAADEVGIGLIKLLLGQGLQMTVDVASGKVASDAGDNFGKHTFNLRGLRSDAKLLCAYADDFAATSEERDHCPR
jgi:hypothetical protein